MAETPYKEKSLKINGILNSIRTVLGLIFPLITFPYASRVLGPDGIGKVSFANSIVSYFSMIAALGISYYGIREAAKVRNNKIDLTKFVKEILTINLISTSIAYVLLGIAILFIPKLSAYRTIIIICSSSILFTTLGIDWLYNALEEFSYITIRSVCFQLLSLVLLFVFVRTKDDLISYAAIGVISSVGSNIFNFIHARKFIDFKLKVKKEYKKHLKPIFTMFFMSVAVSIYVVLDTTMLGFFADDLQIGFYTAASKINKIVVTLITSAIGILLPRLSSYISDNKIDDFKILTQKAFNWVSLLSIPSAVGLTLIAKPIILLFSGTQYEPAIYIMKIMNPIVIAISMSTLFGIQILMPLGKEKITLLSVIIGAISNFTINCILIPKYGALGAGIATTIAESAIAIIQFIFVFKYLSLKQSFFHVLQCVIATVLMAIPVYFIGKFNLNIIIQLIISIVTGILIYGIVLFLLRNKFILDFIHKGKIK